MVSAYDLADHFCSLGLGQLRTTPLLEMKDYLLLEDGSLLWTEVKVSSDCIHFRLVYVYRW